MTIRGEQNPPEALNAIRDLERTLSDTVKHRAFAAESRQEARREADRLIADAQDRGSRAAERAREEVRSASELETRSIPEGADGEIAVLLRWLALQRAKLLVDMRTVAVPETFDRPEA